MKVGAWAESSVFKDPSRDLDAALACGLSELGCVVNNAYKNKSWHLLAPHKKIETAVRLFHDAGLEVSLMTWVVPSLGWANGMLTDLFPLAAALPVWAVEDDIEEPWTRARTKGAREEYAAHMRSHRAYSRDFARGANAIVYTPHDKFGLVAADADYVCAQAYGTNRWKGQHLFPGRIQKTALRLWEPRYGARRCRRVMGVPAYRLKGAGGHSTQRAMTLQLDACRDIGVELARFWSLRHLRGSEAKTRWVRDWVRANS